MGLFGSGLLGAVVHVIAGSGEPPFSNVTFAPLAKLLPLSSKNPGTASGPNWRFTLVTVGLKPVTVKQLVQEYVVVVPVGPETLALYVPGAC